MIGVIVNCATIVVASIIGTVAKKNIPERATKAAMHAMGLGCLFMGIQGALVGKNILVLMLSLVIGTIIGTVLNLEQIIVNAGIWLKKKVAKNSKDNATFVDAFVTASILMGIGAMAILGGIEAGINHNYSIYFLKSIMDSVSAISLSASMGIGVAWSAISIFILQGGMVLLARFIKPLVEDGALMNEIACVGNIMIIALGFNLLNMTKLKVTNMLPAIILVPIFYYITIQFIK